MRVNPVKLPIEIRLVNIAQCDDLGVFVSQERMQVLHAAITDAQARDPHAFVGPDHSARSGGLHGAPEAAPAIAAWVNVRRLKRVDMAKPPEKLVGGAEFWASSQAGLFSATIYPITVEISRFVAGSR